MTFSLIFLTHTALLLGQGQLQSDYSIDSSKCRNELFRAARIAQESRQSLSNSQAAKLEKRIMQFCYNNRVTGAAEALEIPILGE